ncbi:MAG: hypothetical protein WC485_00140 [Opitutaceae bacterium]
MKVEGVERLKRALQQAASRYFDSPNAVKGTSVIVGYTAAYALHVHERNAAHKPGKQWKYLEQPARELATNELPAIVTEAVANGSTMQQALYLAGLRIQRASQAIVPVDTGNLRGSAFTRKE